MLELLQEERQDTAAASQHVPETDGHEFGGFVTLSLSKGAWCDWHAMTVNKWALSLFIRVIPAKAGIQFLFIFLDTGTRALQGMRRYDLIT